MLQNAWETIQKNNASGGIDNVTIKSFGDNLGIHLSSIKKMLLEKTYLPEPYLNISIPKDDNSWRQLGLPTIADKVVQQLIAGILSPKLEKIFLDSNYGYRPEKGSLRAVQRVRHIIGNEKKIWLVKCDIDNFFETINHDRLSQLIRPFISNDYLLELTMCFIKMGHVDRYQNWKDRNLGIPQGAILSPLLANLYLHALDQRMNDKHYSYVRYADDFVFLFNKKEEAEVALKNTIPFIENRLFLKVNDHPHIKHVSDGFKFLGVIINNEGVVINTQKQEKLKQKLKTIIERNPDKLISKLNEATYGMNNYYCKLIHHHYLYPVDEALCEMLTATIIDNHKQLKTQKAIFSFLSEIRFITPHFCKSLNIHIKQIAANVITKRKAESKGKTEDAIKIRKKEYEKRAAGNREIVISGFNKSIGIAKGVITIKENGKVIHVAKPHQLKTITITTPSCGISSKVIHFCAEHNISIDLLDRNGLPAAKLYSASTADAQLWLLQMKHAHDHSLNNSIMLNLIENKILNQQYLLKYYHKYYKNTDLQFADFFANAVKEMNLWIENAHKLTAENDIEKLRLQLMACEGNAASCYWQSIKILIDEETDFESRKRQGAEDLVNCMLNYGYGILYSRVHTAILQAKLNPYISHLHTPQNGKPTLVFDLIEQFRQAVVDRPVFALINRQTELKVKNGLLTDATKEKLIEKILERLNSFELYRGERVRLGDIINRQVADFAKYLTGETDSLRFYTIKW